MTGRHNTIKVSTLSKWMYRFSAIIIKLKEVSFWKLTANSQIYGKFEGPRMAKIILKSKT